MCSAVDTVTITDSMKMTSEDMDSMEASYTSVESCNNNNISGDEGKINTINCVHF